jgi:hypothetical protein
MPETLGRHASSVPRTTVRNRAAAALFATFGIGAIASAIVGSDAVLAGVGAISLAAALLAIRSFPLDRDW